MIQITDKSNCCGCSACAQRCPKECISMQEDTKGFLYPTIDANTCIDCGACERVCPVLNVKHAKEPLLVCAAYNNDNEIRNNSSSGGIFTPLAENIIQKGGVVFGAQFNDSWLVDISYTSSMDELSQFRGSKYLQARVGDTYQRCKSFLDEGRPVLFSGTPCQIAGLKKYLHKEYENLLTIDVLCHGVPSPKVWKDYLTKITNEYHILDISFRDKTNGWKNYALRIEKKAYNSTTDKSITTLEQKKQNIFMQAFIAGFILRPCCFNCPSKSGKSSSDITIGDFWGLSKYVPEFDDNKGTSIVYVNSEKGLKYYSELDITSKTMKKEICYNTAFTLSANQKYPIDVFWKKYENEGLDCIPTIYKTIIHRSFKQRMANKIHNIIKGFLK